MITLLQYFNVWIFFIIKRNDYGTMLWSLWIIYILFAEKFNKETHIIVL